MSRLIYLCFLCFFFFTVVLTQEPTAGKRATWIPVSWGDTTEANTQRTMQSLASLGVNRVYIDVWNNGKTYFNSSTMYSLVGSGGIGSDQLAWGVKYAKQYGMEVYAWFEYGNMAAYSSISTPFAKKAQQLGWISGSADGFVWMNPSNHQVIEFLGGIMTDAVKAQPRLDGVQLDDHFAWPSSLPGSNVQAMTKAAQDIRAIFRNVSNAYLSLAPNPLTVSIQNYNVDWKTWANMGLFSEYAPQLYTSSYSTFDSELQTTLGQIPSSVHKYMLAGIRCNGSGSPTSWDQLNSMISDTQKNGLGVSIWYGQCIVELYPSQFNSIW